MDTTHQNSNDYAEIIPTRLLFITLVFPMINYNNYPTIIPKWPLTAYQYSTGNLGILPKGTPTITSQKNNQ